MFKIPLIDKELNDHIEPNKKFYKRKTFWLAVLGAGTAVLMGDYTAIVPVALEIFNGLTA